MKTTIEDYNTKFDSWRKKAFDLKDSEVELTKLLSLSLVYEQVKKNPDLAKEFYRAIRAAKCVSFDNNNEHLIIDFGDTKYFIEDAEFEIWNKIYFKIWYSDETNFKFEEDKKDYCYFTTKEQLSDFDLAHYAVENLNRWETIEE
jgi:hypothetical protein